MKDYTNQIVYNERTDGRKIYYVVKSYDGYVLRVEQFNKQPKEDVEEAINLQDLKNNKRLNIVYYGYGRFGR